MCHILVFNNTFFYIRFKHFFSLILINEQQTFNKQINIFFLHISHYFRHILPFWGPITSEPTYDKRDSVGAGTHRQTQQSVIGHVSYYFYAPGPYFTNAIIQTLRRFIDQLTCRLCVHSDKAWSGPHVFLASDRRTYIYTEIVLREWVI